MTFIFHIRVKGWYTSHAGKDLRHFGEKTRARDVTWAAPGCSACRGGASLVAHGSRLPRRRSFCDSVLPGLYLFHESRSFFSFFLLFHIVYICYLNAAPWISQKCTWCLSSSSSFFVFRKHPCAGLCIKPGKYTKVLSSTVLFHAFELYVLRPLK